MSICLQEYYCNAYGGWKHQYWPRFIKCFEHKLLAAGGVVFKFGDPCKYEQSWSFVSNFCFGVVETVWENGKFPFLSLWGHVRRHLYFLLSWEINMMSDARLLERCRFTGGKYSVINVIFSRSSTKSTWAKTFVLSGSSFVWNKLFDSESTAAHG